LWIGQEDDSTANMSTDDIVLGIVTGLAWLSVVPFLRLVQPLSLVVVVAESCTGLACRFVAIFLPLHLGFSCIFYLLTHIKNLPTGFLSTFEMAYFRFTLDELLEDVRADSKRYVIIVCYLVYVLSVWILLTALFHASLVRLIYFKHLGGHLQDSVRLARVRALLSLERTLPNCLKGRLGDPFYDSSTDMTEYWMMYETVAKDTIYPTHRKKEGGTLPTKSGGSTTFGVEKEQEHEPK